MKSMDEMNNIADTLDKMQASENWCRGVSCVRDIVLYLKSNKLDEACAITRNDWDKIRSYSNISKYCIEQGLYVPFDFEKTFE